MVRLYTYVYILVVILATISNIAYSLKLSSSRISLPLKSMSLSYMSMSDTGSSSNTNDMNAYINNKTNNNNIKKTPEGFFNIVGLSSKLFVSGIATIVLYSTDSWGPLYYIICSILNGVLSKILKNTIKEPRPIESNKSGYGMPSSHTQSFFFFLAVVSLNASRFLGYKEAVFLSLLMALYSCVASYWRVVAGVHSFSQVKDICYLFFVICCYCCYYYTIIRCKI